MRMGVRRGRASFGSAMVAVVLGALAACGAPAPQDGPTAPATPSGTAPPGEDGADVVLAVAVEVADAGGVSALVTPSAGGVLETTGPDGTRYRLEVPPGAVVAAVPVTMTPLASVAGEMVDGLVGGVDLAPDGLQLGRTATLTIEPARQVPVEAQVPFGYSGDGTEAMLAPMDPDPGRMAVWLGHFSGYGVLESTDARMEMNARLAAAEAARASTYHQRVAAVFAELRVQAMLGTGTGRLDADALGRIRAIHEEYLRDHLLPRIEYAERLSTSGNPGDLAYISDVLAEVVELERMSVLLGVESALPVAATVLLGRIQSNVRAALEARCAEENDFTVVPILLEIERAIQLLGGEAGADPFGCADFEVRMSSHLRILGPWPELAGTVEAAVPVQMLVAAEEARTPLPWQWTDEDRSCDVQARQEAVGDLVVASATFELPDGAQAYRADGRLVPPADLVVLYDLGPAQTAVAWEDCQQTHGYWLGDYVRDAWSRLHADEDLGGAWVLTDWEMLFDGPLVARKVVERTVPDLEVCFPSEGFCWPLPVEAVETTTWEMVHTP